MQLHSVGRSAGAPAAAQPCSEGRQPFVLVVLAGC